MASEQASEQSSKSKGIFQVTKRSISEFSSDDMLTYAAALAYQIFFSLFPFIIFILGLLGLLNLQSVFDWLIQQANTVMPKSSASLVDQIVNQVKGGSSGGALSIGAAIALYSASGAVRGAMHAMNIAYDIPIEDERPFWKKFPLSIIYTLLLTVMLIVSVVLLFFGGSVAQWFSKLVGLGSWFVTLWSIGRIPLALVLLMFSLAVIYYLFPNHQNQPFRLVSPGAIMAVIVWIVASLAFSWYVSNFGSYSKTYGSIAAVIVLLLYFYISSAILLFGAEVNAETYRQVAPKRYEEDEAVGRADENSEDKESEEG